MKRWMTEDQAAEYLRRRSGRPATTRSRSGQGVGTAIQAKRPKYGNRRVEIDGVWFDSEKEGRQYEQLKLAQKAGEISGLTVHPSFNIEIKGVFVCRYVADFSYLDKAGNYVCEDVKGVRTPAYRIKRQLMAACHGILIQEI